MMSDIDAKIAKALEYANNGDPIRDVIYGDAEWFEVLERASQLRERLIDARETNQKALSRNVLLANERDAYSNENGELRERVAALEEQQVWLYNQGYRAGHNDTVEGCYTDVFPCDMTTYHADDVAELMREDSPTVGDEGDDYPPCPYCGQDQCDCDML